MNLWLFIGSVLVFGLLFFLEWRSHRSSGGRKGFPKSRRKKDA